MAIFTADEYGSAIKHCWLNGADVTRLTTCACIPDLTRPVDLAALPPPAGVVIEVSRRGLSFRINENGDAGVLAGQGWVDLLDTGEEGYPHFIVGNDSKPVASRHTGTVKLEWKDA